VQINLYTNRKTRRTGKLDSPVRRVLIIFMSNEGYSFFTF
jgi:hypothetical protein